MRQAVLIVACGLAALGACQKKPGETDAASAAGAAEPTAATAPSMDRKAGLWAQTVTTGGQSQTMKLCLDPATDKQIQITGQAMGQDACSENSMTPAPGGVSFRSVCASPGAGTTTTTGTATGDFADHYTVKATSVTSGATMAQANGTHEVTIDAKWEGPCPAGMTPGDMQMNGMTINVAKMMGAAGKAPAGK